MTNKKTVNKKQMVAFVLAFLAVIMMLAITPSVAACGDEGHEEGESHDENAMMDTCTATSADMMQSGTDADTILQRWWYEYSLPVLGTILLIATICFVVAAARKMWKEGKREEKNSARREK